LSGDQDEVTPPTLARKVYQALPGADKQFVIVPCAGHNNALSNPGTAPALCPLLGARVSRS
jgi:pimeloyl-ACP methyl ester carboxylesterase